MLTGQRLVAAFKVASLKFNPSMPASVHHTVGTLKLKLLCSGQKLELKPKSYSRVNCCVFSHIVHIKSHHIRTGYAACPSVCGLASVPKSLNKFVCEGKNIRL